MLFKEHFEKRIAEIAKAVEESLSSHNALMGHLSEAKWMLEQFLAAELAKKAADDKAAAEAHIPA